jgi:hypothetical protein
MRCASALDRGKGCKACMSEAQVAYALPICRDLSLLQATSKAATINRVRAGYVEYVDKKVFCIPSYLSACTCIRLPILSSLLDNQKSCLTFHTLVQNLLKKLSGIKSRPALRIAFPQKFNPHSSPIPGSHTAKQGKRTPQKRTRTRTFLSKVRGYPF